MTAQMERSSSVLTVKMLLFMLEPIVARKWQCAPMCLLENLHDFFFFYWFISKLVILLIYIKCVVTTIKECTVLVHFV